jgi:hypothetical protein
MALAGVVANDGSARWAEQAERGRRDLDSAAFGGVGWFGRWVTLFCRTVCAALDTSGQAR